MRWLATPGRGIDGFRFVDEPPRAPGPGEVTIAITAAGVNPADLKHVRRADPAGPPIRVGYEITGHVSALGPGTVLASGSAEIGARVVAFRVRGGYADTLTVAGADVFALPPGADDAAAAGLLLAGTTAAELLERSGARPGETVVMHGASGAVGAILLQLARLRGVRVVGTAGPQRQAAVARFGGIPVEYGPGLVDRLRAAAPGNVVAALDAAGTAEAVAASLDLVPDRNRIITIAAPGAAREHGFAALAGSDPRSAAFRDSVRAQLISLFAEGALQVDVARTFPLDRAPDALALVAAGRAHGKVILR